MRAFCRGPSLTVLDASGAGPGAHAAADPVGRPAYEYGFSQHRMIGTDLDPVGFDHPWLHEFRLGDGVTIPYADHIADVIMF